MGRHWAEWTWGSALQVCGGQGAGSVHSQAGCGVPAGSSLPGMDWSSLGAVPSLLPLGPTLGSETVTLLSELRPLRLPHSWQLGWLWCCPLTSEFPPTAPSSFLPGTVGMQPGGEGARGELPGALAHWKPRRALVEHSGVRCGRAGQGGKKWHKRISLLDEPWRPAWRRWHCEFCPLRS